MSRVYLDWNATAPLHPMARDAMIKAMETVGNPSSVHHEGRGAKAIVETARSQLADFMGCERADLVFAGTATEAAAMAFNPTFKTLGSGLDHSAVFSHLGDDPDTLNVDANGIYLGNPTVVDKDIIALQSANSETGVLQNTLSIAQAVWKSEGDTLILVDAVQSFGKTKYSISQSGADFALASPHKFGGPKGVGVLYVKPNVETHRLYAGGGQEEGRRAGTENLIGLAGAGAAAQAAAQDVKDGIWDQLKELRDMLENIIADAAPNAIFMGQGADRLPNTSSFAVPGWKGETQVMQMDLAGFAISAGSACSSGKVKPSQVLKAMGFDDITAASAVRVSFGPATTKQQLLDFADAWIKAYRKHMAKAA